MQDAFDNVTFHESEKVFAKTTGEEKYRVPWAQKLAYATEAMELFKSMKCNVVILFHEQQRRDEKTGDALDKIEPLMQGKFNLELKRHFPYFVRQWCRQPLDANDKPDPKARPEYVWQIVSNDSFDAKYIGKPDRPRFVPANYSSLIKAK
jgi:hypothetical protein